MDIEEWRPIPGYESLYWISNLARIMSLDYKHTGRRQILKLSCTKGRYIKVTLRNINNATKTFWLHRLVAIVFVENPDPQNRPEVDHIDGNRLNNVSSNLRWVDGRTNTNNPNTQANRRLRYHRPGEFERRSAAQIKRFQKPEERARLLEFLARGRATAKRNREIRQTETIDQSDPASRSISGCQVHQ